MRERPHLVGWGRCLQDFNERRLAVCIGVATKNCLSMKPSILASTTLLFLSVGLLLSAQAHLEGHKLDDAQCSAAWAKASPDGKPVSYDRVEPYIVDFNIVDMDEGDGIISSEQFKAACVDGHMRSPEEVAKAMETQKPPPTPTEIEYTRMLGAWNAAGTEARQRFREYIGKSN